MVTKEEFNKIGKKYGLAIYESIFGGYLTYVKDGIAVSVYDIENKIVSVNNKFFVEKCYETAKVVNDIEELENEVQTTLKNFKLYKIRQKIDRIAEDFE
jgi:hypothetical protein